MAPVPVKGATALLLVDKLRNDDAFRTRLQSNPVATLAELGITVNPSDIPERFSIPSKETVTSIASWPMPQKFVPWFGTQCALSIELG